MTIITRERVRGMNAALAAGGAGLIERERRPPHITRLQVALAVILAAVAVGVGLYTFRAVRSSAQTFPAAVSTSQTVDLNFPNPERVVAILVRPGQHVTAGEVLARQDTSVLESTVTADTAIVNADQAAIAQAEAPQLSDPQKTAASLQVQQAQASVQSATSALASAKALGDALVAAAQAAVTTDQNVVNEDNARLAQACPNGAVPPGAQATVVQMQAYVHCQDLQAQLNRDQAALTMAQAQVGPAVAQENQNISDKNAALASAQLALSVAQNALAIQTAPTTAAAVAQARANLTQAQANLDQAKAALQQAVITAPFSGTVAEVYGAVGQFLGPDGVRQYAGPSALPSTQLPSFQLFPSTPATPNGRTGSGQQPLIQMNGGKTQIVAQVRENAVGRFAAGRSARVSINAVQWSGSGTVVEIVLAPAQSSGAVTYDVVLDLNSPPKGLLPGMSASVTAG